MNSDDIFLERMANLVFIEKRAFSYKDFLLFEHDGKEYKFAHGTIRNIFSKLTKLNKIELVYNAGIAFHTLKGVDVGGKSITLYHTEDYLNHKQQDFVHFLKAIPMDKPAIHDIRLNFSLKGLWSILSQSSNDLIVSKDSEYNKDIRLSNVILEDNNNKIKTTVHRTDKVSVIVSCSHHPIMIDYYGTMKLTAGLAKAEERLQILVDKYIKSDNTRYSIPSHMEWIVKMWHFGQDSLTEYSGDKFAISWKEALELFRIYSKKS